MKEDRLAQYRRTPTANPPGVAQGAAPVSAPRISKGEAPYVAFEGRDNPSRLFIRTKKAERAPGYGVLYDVITDGRYGTEIVLIYNIVVVTILGRNLQELAVGIANSMVHFIQEFDSDRWEAPTDDRAAFIESIEFVAAGDKPRGEDRKSSREPSAT